MPMVICDPDIVSEFESEREVSGANKYDEVWNGAVYVMSLPNVEHQQLVGRLSFVFQSILGFSAPHQVLPGVNVSDRIDGWTQNYREPDFAIYLDGNAAVNCGTHWCGGPDFLVEIVSPGDPTRDKLPFYASVNTREVLIVDRDPWQLELHQLQGGKMVPAGRSTLSQPDLLKCVVLPVTFQLIAGPARPQIEIVHAAGGQAWRA